MDGLLAGGADVVYHLAAVVSGAAEADFDLGLSVNLFGSINLLEAARRIGTRPVFVFTSSVGVYGGEAPAPIGDGTVLNPQISCGAQKAAVELLVTDYSRRGFVDGRAVRVAGVTIRPGRPNAAASSFMSSIFREPLMGEPAVCPVAPDYPIWYCSPRRTIENLVHAAEVPADALGMNRAFALPGRTDTVADMIAAMSRVAGPGPARLIRFEPDERLLAIVKGWRADIVAEKALRLGFVRDAGFEDNVRFFLEEREAELRR